MLSLRSNFKKKFTMNSNWTEKFHLDFLHTKVFALGFRKFNIDGWNIYENLIDFSLKMIISILLIFVGD